MNKALTLFIRDLIRRRDQYTSNFIQSSEQQGRHEHEGQERAELSSHTGCHLRTFEVLGYSTA